MYLLSTFAYISVRITFVPNTNWSTHFTYSKQFQGNSYYNSSSFEFSRQNQGGIKHDLPVHLNSWEGRAWMGRSCKWAGKAHRGPPVVKPLVLNQSANHAIWQLQLNGLAIKLSDCNDTNASNAPGVTHRIWLEYNDKVFRFTKPWKIFLLTCLTAFSARILQWKDGS